MSERVWGENREAERSGEEVGSRKYLTLFSFPFGPLGFSESAPSPSDGRFPPPEDVSARI